MANSNWHSAELEKVKKAVGASFVAYERVKDNYYLKIVRNKVLDLHPLTGTPDDVTSARYKELIATLKQHYEQI